MTKKKLKYCPYGQCHAIIDENGAIALVSYRTTVIVIDPMGWLTCFGTYSATTRKHIGAFMKEYTNFSYHTAKDAFLNNYTINIHTGEVVKLGEA